ncbi:hypothetical protein [Paenibacillus sp. GCM10023250]|uniref:hypothetical protein n=1 Tax=Paenibacillus sp. GCM10023250 TaxID=3252648 RepID=UPI00360BC574
MEKVDIKQQLKLDSFSQELLTESLSLLQLNHQDIRRERFIKGVFCPHCLQSSGKIVSNYVRFGFVNGTGWQRYQCKHCKHIFSDLTRTFFHRSRNVHKWPLFIQYLLQDRLPLKQIATKLELHFNTIYAWKKKLSAFFELYLPNRNFQPSDQSSYDCTTLSISCPNKGNSAKSDDKSYEVQNTTNNTEISVIIAVNRENPSRVLFSIAKDYYDASVHLGTQPSAQLSKVVHEIQQFCTKKRGFPARNLFMHLNFFRMLKLTEAINPAIMASEIIKICLDKDHLSRSNRLLKRLI